MLNATIATHAVEKYHKQMSIDWSYGDWMANRQFVWRGSYLEKNETLLHLGLDLNVVPGTVVALDHDAKVLRIDDDTPDEHGWGNRVIVQLEHAPIVLVYAHLSPAIKCKVGDQLSAGSIIGEVGTPEENGGWFPHLHVQAIELEYYKELMRNDLRDLDGYGHAHRIMFLAVQFPDPMQYIRLT
jgi:murein DD-endopeptidase MepM/ murein hydrolase activator NlpD